MSQQLVWVKAKASQSSGNCVETTRDGDKVLVRHSRHPAGDPLEFTVPEFAAFLDGAKRDEFDHLLA